MSMNYEDFPVAPRSIIEIEAAATALRKQLNCQGDACFPAIAEALGALGYTIQVRSDIAMKNAQAYADAEACEIYARSDIAAKLQDDTPEGRWLGLHELGHINLGHAFQANAFFVDNGNKLEAFLTEETSGEKQASNYADAVLMPRSMVLSTTDARQLATIARAPLVRAFTRFNHVRRGLSRQTPETITSGIEKLRAIASHQTSSRAGIDRGLASRKRSLWLALPVAPGADRMHRIVDGRWYVCFDLFERSRPGGWRIADGIIVAWEDEHSR